MIAALSRRCVQRPVSAGAVALGIALAGNLALGLRPWSLLPRATPKAIEVIARYPGADTQTIVRAVASPIEQQINAVAGVRSLLSTSRDGGDYKLTATWDPRADAAEVLAAVQGRVNELLPRLPSEVAREGVRVRPATAGVVIVVNLFPRDDLHYGSSLSHESAVRAQRALERIAGVGRVDLLGVGNPALNVRLDPDRLRSSRLTVAEVEAALRERCQSELIGSPADLQNTVLRAGESGLLRLSDVAEVERSAEGGGTEVALNRTATAALLVHCSASADAETVSDGVRAAMDGLKASFPGDFDYTIAHDAASFSTSLVGHVALLVLLGTAAIGLIWYLLTQQVRASVAVVASALVVVLGVPAVALATGSVNAVTLFTAMAAGAAMVSDFAMLCNAAWHRVQNRETDAETIAVDAAVEMAGPLALAKLVVTLALAGWLFHHGVAAQLWHDAVFALAAAAITTTAMGLVLGPAFLGWILASWLSPEAVAKQRLLVVRVLRFGLRALHRLIALCGYVVRFMAAVCLAVQRTLVRQPAVALALLAWCGLWLLMPPEDAPPHLVVPEDQGYLIVDARVPGTSTQRTQQQTEQLRKQLRDAFLSMPEVAHAISFLGYSILEEDDVAGAVSLLVILKPSALRKLNARQLAQPLPGLLRGLGAKCVVVLPSSLAGEGGANRLQFMLTDSGATETATLEEITADVVSQARAVDALAGTRANAWNTAPRPTFDVDFDQAARRGISPEALRTTLRCFRGSVDVGSAGTPSGTARILVSVERTASDDSLDLAALQARGGDGGLFSLAPLVSLRDESRTQAVCRHDLSPATIIDIFPLERISDARVAVQSLAESSIEQAGRPSVGFRWLEREQHLEEAARQARWVLAGGTLIACILLAVYFNSGLLPLVVVLSALASGLAAAAAMRWQGVESHLFLGLGAVAAMGLTGSAALTTVNLALRRRTEGCIISESANDAAAWHCPVWIHTGVAAVAATLPLMLAPGVGTTIRGELGTALVAGVVSSFVVSVCVVPVLFVVVQWIREWAFGRQGPLEDIWHLSDWLRPLGLLRRPFARPVTQLRTYLLRIVTVTGPLPPHQARVVLPHEHVILDLRGTERKESDRDEDPEQLLRAIHDYVGYLPLYGAHTLVDGATQYQGRNAMLLHQLSVSTGVQIITNTGYTAIQGGEFLPPHVFEASADQIAQRWVGELRDGIEGTGVRPGFIKIGLDPGSLQETDRKLVVAAARTHLQTGLTIASDTAHYESAAEQLALLGDEGVAPEAWIWLHAQRESRTNLILAAAQRGAWVLVDDFTEDNLFRRVNLLRSLKHEGLLERTLVSQNALGYQITRAQRSPRVQRYDQVFKLLIPALLRTGFDVDDIQKLTVVNPRNAYTTRFRPVPEPAAGELASRKPAAR